MHKPPPPHPTKQLMTRLKTIWSNLMIAISDWLNCFNFPFFYRPNVFFYLYFFLYFLILFYFILFFLFLFAFVFYGLLSYFHFLRCFVICVYQFFSNNIAYCCFSVDSFAHVFSSRSFFCPSFSYILLFSFWSYF